MIALSSFRPHNLSDEYRANQIRAKKSWDRVFEKVVYLANYEADLDSDKTSFLGYSGWPRINELAQVAAAQPSMVALVNADIVVTDPIVQVERKMVYTGIQAAVSRRFEFDASNPDFTMAVIVDKGLDIFVTTPRMWKLVAAEIPENLRIGQIQFDTWLTGFFLVKLRNAFRDFSRFKCVFHPKHGGRDMPYNPTEPLKDRYSVAARLPEMM